MRKQIALCIGNDDYQYSCLSKLQCAANDCQAVAEKLEQLCFNVTKYDNLDRESMHEAIDRFEQELPNYDVALFYYAGHGFESNGSKLVAPPDMLVLTINIDDKPNHYYAIPFNCSLRKAKNSV